jgi:hypothetical protein
MPKPELIKIKRKKKPIIRGPNGGAREGSGRKLFVPTEQERKQVEMLAGCGVPYVQIAALVRDGIHMETLRAKFPDDLMRGKAKANAAVGRNLFEKAMGGDVACMIWWTKSQMGWKDTTAIEHTGKNGGPIAVATLDVSKLSIETMEQIMLAKDAADANASN